MKKKVFEKVVEYEEEGTYWGVVLAVISIPLLVYASIIVDMTFISLFLGAFIFVIVIVAIVALPKGRKVLIKQLQEGKGNERL